MKNLSVAIIIPSRNEEAYIGKCLDSIIKNNFDKNKLEVIVCDGESIDHTIDIIKQYTQKYPFIKYLNNTHKTTPHALNLGIENSNSDLKMILGAHAEIDKLYIKNCVSVFSSYPDLGCVGGVLENVPENHISRIIGLAMSSSFGVGNAHFRTGTKNGYVDTVAFGAYRSDVLEKIGYFDENLIRNQDDEINFRLTNSGYKIYLSSSINAKYYVRGSIKKLFRQYYQYGYWKVFVNRKHKTVTTIRQLIPLFFVLFLIFGSVLSLIGSFFLYGFISILIIYLLCALVSAIKKSTKIIEVGLIIYTFLVLHISYGFGYLQGIIDFVLLNKKTSASNTKLSR